MKNSGEKARCEGACLCGAVRFEVTGALRPVVNCHCRQCLSWHGHFSAYTACGPDELKFLEDRGLKWFCSSKIARRGFCGECGSSLFWAPEHGGHISIAAGVLSQPCGLRTVGDIYVQDKGDYYAIPAGTRQFGQSSGGYFDQVREEG